MAFSSEATKAKRRLDETAAAEQLVDLQRQAGRLGAVEVEANQLVVLRPQQRDPEAGDAARPLVFHDDPFLPPLVGFDADELLVIVVGEPGLGVGGIGLRPIVAAGLQAAEGRRRQPGQAVAIDHFGEQAGESNRLGPAGGGG